MGSNPFHILQWQVAWLLYKRVGLFRVPLQLLRPFLSFFFNFNGETEILPGSGYPSRRDITLAGTIIFQQGFEQMIFLDDFRLRTIAMAT